MRLQDLSIREEDVQRAVIDGLTALGYLVRQTTVRGFRPRNGKGYGASKGVPDLIVTRVGWGASCELEAKGTKTRPSPEQQDLADKGVLVIVRSLDQAMSALAAFERRHGLKGACSMRVSA